MSYIPAELILKKKQGLAHTPEEIDWLIQKFTDETLPDYQMAAWAMAVCFKGMNEDEVATMTLAMKRSGSPFDFSYLNSPRIDKHSTGGVGDKTSLILGPLFAAAGIHAPMIAGRGLGHTGGTLDKLTSIPGFRVDLSREEFQKLVENSFFAIMGQTADICPADRKLYALRDVTATVDSIPLICASIMSKKLSEDLTGLVLDVKFGTGAFMKNADDAENLALWLKAIGERNGVQTRALLTNMDEPLGRFAGNACEVTECIQIMNGEKCLYEGVDFYEPTRELTMSLASHGIVLAGKATDLAQGRQMAEDLLKNGSVFNEFTRLCQRQGPARVDDLPQPKISKIVGSPSAGTLLNIHTEKLGWALVALGAGRIEASDAIDPTAGIEFFVRSGQPVEKGQPLFRLFAETKEQIEKSEAAARNAFVISSQGTAKRLPLILKVIT